MKIKKFGYLILIALSLVLLIMGTVSASGIDNYNATGSLDPLCSSEDLAISDSFSDALVSDSSEDVLVSDSFSDALVSDSSEDYSAFLGSVDNNENSANYEELSDALDDKKDKFVLSDDYESKLNVEINSYDISDANPHSVNINNNSDYLAKIYAPTESEGNVTIYIGKEYDNLSEHSFIEDIQSLDHEIDENDTDYSTFYIRMEDLENVVPDWYYVLVAYRFGWSLNETDEEIVRFVEDSKHVNVKVPSEIVIGDWSQSYLTVFVENNLGYIRVLIDNNVVFEDSVDNLVYDENEGYNYYIPIYMGDLSIGSHTYNVSYYDGSFENQSFEGTIDVTYLFDLRYDDEIDYGEEANIQVVLPYDASGKQILVNGNPYEITLEDGIGNLVLSDLELGDNLLVFTYNDSIYGEKSIIAPLIVNPKFTVPEIVYVENGDKISFKLPNDAQGELNIYVYDDNDEPVLKDSVGLINGEANYTFDSWSFGSYDILVEYDDGNYVASNESSIYILPYVDLSNETAISEDANLSVNIPGISGSIAVNVNGEELAVKEIVNGKINLSIPADVLHLGENIVTLIYEGDDLDSNPFSYDEDGVAVPIEYVILVKPAGLTIPNELGVNESGNISLNLPEGSSGNLTVYVGDEIVSTTPVSSGENNIPLSGLELGDNEVKVTLTDENGYEYISSQNVRVSKSKLSMGISVPTNSSTAKLSFDLPSDATNSLIVNINGKDYVRTLENGKASISIPNLTDGTYDLVVKYTGDEKYDGFNEKTNVTIKTVKPVILKDPKLTIKVPSIYQGKKAIVTVTTNSTFSGKVTVKVKSKTYTVKIVKGKGSIAISGLAVGTYKAVATFAKNSVFKSSTKTVTFKVKANVYKLTLTKVKVKKYAKKVTIKAGLKINGKIAKAKTLVFKFNKKVYKAKTNSKGIATIIISKSVLKKLKIGKKITYQVSYGKKTVRWTVKVVR